MAASRHGSPPTCPWHVGEAGEAEKAEALPRPAERPHMDVRAGAQLHGRVLARKPNEVALRPAERPHMDVRAGAQLHGRVLARKPNDIALRPAERPHLDVWAGAQHHGRVLAQECNEEAPRPSLRSFERWTYTPEVNSKELGRTHRAWDNPRSCHPIQPTDPTEAFLFPGV